MPDYLPKLIEIAADVLELDPAELSASSGPESVQEWDSVNSLRILIQIERRLGVRVPLEAYSQVRTLHDLERLLQEGT